jgi:quinolinate synthase
MRQKAGLGIMNTNPIAQSTDVPVIEAWMQTHLIHLVPEFEIRLKAELAAQINRLKQERDAVILGHNYMEPALYHAVADIRGDSLELCRQATATDRRVLVFCGVEFMAETAKIINPDRTVLIPSQKAGCSLAASITVEDVRELKRRYPGVPAVAYINTYAAVKAEADVCCTSSSAARIVASLNRDTVIFIPDEYLARNVARETGKTVIFPGQAAAGCPGAKTFIAWHGKCEVHELFGVQDIEDVRRQFPEAVVLAHPECPPAVVEAADFSGSTSAMIRYVQEHPARQYFLLTECAMADNIIAENPEKEVLRMCSHRCPHMAQITLEDTRAALDKMQYEVHVPENIRLRAKASIDRMLAAR